MAEKMKHLLSIALLLGFSISARCEDVKSPETLLRAYVTATGNSDFRSVVDDMHPLVLKRFKEHTAAIVKAAVETYSEKAVIDAFHELKSLEELAGLLEKELWIYVMSNLYSIHPKYDGAKSTHVVGSVQEGNFLYVVYRRTRDLESTDKVEELKTVKTLVFKKHKERWCYFIHMASAVEKYVQQQAKAQHAISEKISE